VTGARTSRTDEGAGAPVPPTFVHTLSRVVEFVDLPFGYTLSIWSAGALAVHRYGTPQVAEVFLFIGGAVGAYLVLLGISRRQIVGGIAVRVQLAALPNVLSLVSATVATLVTGAISVAPLGYLVAGFTATFVYLVALALQITLGIRLGLMSAETGEQAQASSGRRGQSRR
jgi:hypothetical protein